MSSILLLSISLLLEIRLNASLKSFADIVLILELLLRVLVTGEASISRARGALHTIAARQYRPCTRHVEANSRVGGHSREPSAPTPRAESWDAESQHEEQQDSE